jgi:SAM-dependent methyltransferase
VVEGKDNWPDAAKVVAEDDFATSAIALMVEDYLNALRLINRDDTNRILDSGCRFGGITRLTAYFFGVTEVYGVDRNLNALKIAETRGTRTVLHELGTDSLPFSPDFLT